ncbi:peptide deformylase [Spirillospora sp. CA-128828]|uniref:peptide deformylase n=1 Tax=Spirillospora sp. CA-128828 TaxID=3240033 RepID=UPI003D9102C6
MISASSETDERYEGCLNFFDVRGLVPRPLKLEVARTRLDGRQAVIVLNAALARLAGHKIDHLYDGTMSTRPWSYRSSRKPPRRPRPWSPVASAPNAKPAASSTRTRSRKPLVSGGGSGI